MLDLIRHDLALLGVHHDLFASEREVQEVGRGHWAMEVLATRAGLSGHARAAQSHKRMTTGSRRSCSCSGRPQFGDDQDRPIKKSDGSWTYFGADTAYHMQKARKFAR